MSVKYYQYTAALFALLLSVAACKDKEYAIPEPNGGLANDVLKRSLGPNLVGQKIEFAYAMALPADKGKLESATVEASIAGAPTTYLEHRSFYTNASGSDVGVEVGAPSVNKDNTTSVSFTRDTMAATLRYFYVVPEEARGKTVNFKFSAKASNGQTVSYSMGPYNVSTMDMKLDLKVVDNAACYISIADMAVYTAVEAAARPDKIDLVYVFRTPTNYLHSILSPGADPQYLPGVTLPAGVNKVTKLVRAWNLRDQQLARLQFGVFIDDLDFQKQGFEDAANLALNLKEEAGLWIETADGKYKAYLFINSVSNSGKTATISIKRYTVQ